MKILVISQYFWPERFKINDLVIEMQKRGHEVTVLTGWPNYPDGRIYPEYITNPQKFGCLKGIKVLRVPLAARGKNTLCLLANYLSFLFTSVFIGYFKLRQHNFDLVFVNQLSPVTVGLTGIFFAKVKKCPMVMWVLDLWPDTLLAIGAMRPGKAYSLIGELTGFIYQRCALIFVSSKGFIPKIEERLTYPVPISHLPNWAELSFDLEAVAGTPQITDASDCLKIMFGGNIGEAQDFECILNAAELLKGRVNVRWIIVGDGRKKTWVAGELQKRGLEDAVILLGSFPPCHMPNLFLQADCLLITLKQGSAFEATMPGKLQSYLASGKPVIGAIAGETSALLKTSGCGLVSTPGDSEGLSNNVIRFSKMSKNKRQEMGDRAKALFLDEFERNMLMEKLDQQLNAIFEKAT